MSHWYLWGSCRASFSSEAMALQPMPSPVLCVVCWLCVFFFSEFIRLSRTFVKLICPCSGFRRLGVFLFWILQQLPIPVEHSWLLLLRIFGVFPCVLCVFVCFSLPLAFCACTWCQMTIALVENRLVAMCSIKEAGWLQKNYMLTNNLLALFQAFCFPLVFFAVNNLFLWGMVCLIAERYAKQLTGLQV